MIYRICPSCGAALDPGERCDCREETENEPRANPRKLTPTTTRKYKKTAPVLEHRDGQKTEPQPHDSALILPGGGRRSQV